MHSTDGGLHRALIQVFWLGRRSYAHIPPHGKGFVQEACSRTGQTALGKLVPLFGFIAAFWSLYDQTGSAWVLQAEQMECSFLGVTWLPSQACPSLKLDIARLESLD
jgi:POT family proton-dependent oligopeptide transporter